MKAHVWGMLKSTVLDPQGQTIQRALASQGFASVQDVRQGKFFVLNLDGMSRDDAMKLMTVTAFQAEREVAGKWVRAQVSSTQLSTYFVGRQEHDAMRAEAERRGGFVLKAYHDKVLSYGSAPSRYVRALMFGNAIM